MKNSNNKLKMLVLTAMFAAITGILAQVTIPLPLVPITGQTLAVGITATILGSRWGSLSMAVYLLVGAAGIPIFSSLTGGVGILVGPTGGYIYGFILAAFVIGFFLEKLGYTIIKAFIANVIGALIILTIGMIHLKFASDLPWDKALLVGIYPFIVGGLIKAVLASWIGVTVRKRLVTARLVEDSELEKSA